jgi:hypothetical protein
MAKNLNKRVVKTLGDVFYARILVFEHLLHQNDFGHDRDDMGFLASRPVLACTCFLEKCAELRILNIETSGANFGTYGSFVLFRKISFYRGVLYASMEREILVLKRSLVPPELHLSSATPSLSG